MNTNPMKERILPRLQAFVLAAMAATLLSASAPFAAAQNNGDRQVVLASGTVIPVTLNNELSSKHTPTGFQFTANVDDSRPGYSDILSGARVDGVVSNATPQQGQDPGTLTLTFTRIQLSDGRTVDISGSPISLDSKDVSPDDNGVLIAKTTKKDNTATYAGIGAGAGALIDVLTGHNIHLGNILVGGGLGAVAGQILKNQPQVHDVDLPRGTAIGVRLDHGTQYYHRIHRDGGNINALPPSQPTQNPGNPNPSPAHRDGGDHDAMPAGQFNSNGALAVIVNDSPVNFPGQGPIETDGRVLVPLRGVLEKMGAYVSYDAGSKQVRAVRNQVEIVLPIGSRTAQINGSPVSLDAPAEVVNGSTMVPLRFVAEGLGAHVNYDAGRNAVFIRNRQ